MLYGEKPSIVIAPSKKGTKNTTSNLLFSKAVKLNPLIINKLNLKFFFQFYSFQNNLYS